MPHFGATGGKPIHERSGRELIVMFVVFPIAAGIGLLTLVAAMLLQAGGPAGWRDWFSIGWSIVVAAVLMLGLPATAWREWERRKQFRHEPAEEPAPPAESER